MGQNVYNRATEQFRQRGRNRAWAREVEAGRVKRGSSESTEVKHRRGQRAKTDVLVDECLHLGKVLGFPSSAIWHSIEVQGVIKTRSALKAAKKDRRKKAKSKRAN